MKPRSLKKKLFHLSTLITCIITVPLLIFVTIELLKTKDILYTNSIKSEEYKKLEQESQFAYNLLNSIFKTETRNKEFASITVDATGYNALDAQCDKDAHITANGELSMIGTIAMSRDLSRYGINLNDIVYIPQYGVFKVSDSMNARFSKRIDFMMGNKKAAELFGIKRNIKIYYFKG